MQIIRNTRIYSSNLHAGRNINWRNIRYVQGRCEIGKKKINFLKGSLPHKMVSRARHLRMIDPLYCFLTLDNRCEIKGTYTPSNLVSRNRNSTVIGLKYLPHIRRHNCSRISVCANRFSLRRKTPARELGSIYIKLFLIARSLWRTQLWQSIPFRPDARPPPPPPPPSLRVSRGCVSEGIIARYIVLFSHGVSEGCALCRPCAATSYNIIDQIRRERTFARAILERNFAQSRTRRENNPSIFAWNWKKGRRNRTDISRCERCCWTAISFVVVLRLTIMMPLHICVHIYTVVCICFFYRGACYGEPWLPKLPDDNKNLWERYGFVALLRGGSGYIINNRLSCVFLSPLEWLTHLFPCQSSPISLNLHAVGWDYYRTIRKYCSTHATFKLQSQSRDNIFRFFLSFCFFEHRYFYLYERTKSG